MKSNSKELLRRKDVALREIYQPVFAVLRGMDDEALYITAASYAKRTGEKFHKCQGMFRTMMRFGLLIPASTYICRPFYREITTWTLDPASADIPRTMPTGCIDVDFDLDDVRLAEKAANKVAAKLFVADLLQKHQPTTVRELTDLSEVSTTLIEIHLKAMISDGSAFMLRAGERVEQTRHHLYAADESLLAGSRREQAVDKPTTRYIPPVQKRDTPNFLTMRLV